MEQGRDNGVPVELHLGAGGSGGDRVDYIGFAAGPFLVGVGLDSELDAPLDDRPIRRRQIFFDLGHQGAAIYIGLALGWLGGCGCR